MNLSNRPKRENFLNSLDWKRSMEHYIYWLGQEKLAMEIALKKGMPELKDLTGDEVIESRHGRFNNPPPHMRD